jgi:hypothetical protein
MAFKGFGAGKETVVNKNTSLACVALTLLAGQAVAKSALSPEAIIAEINRNGATATVRRLWGTADASAWNAVADHIMRGEAAWIALVPKLAAGADAATAEDLGIDLAYALPKNPLAVLRAIDPADGFVIGASRVCSVPFIEPSARFQRRYKARAIAAVSRVKDPKLSKVQRDCLSVLRGS